MNKHLNRAMILHLHDKGYQLLIEDPRAINTKFLKCIFSLFIFSAGKVKINISDFLA
jgi:hypothetical protein